MMIKLLDCKKKNVLGVKVEINKYMFIVAPEILDDKFKCLEGNFRQIRHANMITYLNYTDNDKTEEGAIKLEQKIKEDIINLLEDKVKEIHQNEGLMFYINIE